jgi:hypothetical protein
VALLGVAALVACTTPKTTIEPNVLAEELGFIDTHSTSRDEVISRLGKPHRMYEDGRIVTYTLRMTDAKDLQVAATYRVEQLPRSARKFYSLVIAFDHSDVVSRASLVRVR